MKVNSILLVEDNPEDEELALRALNKSHLQGCVEVAHDGQQAIEMLFGSELSEDKTRIEKLESELKEVQNVHNKSDNDMEMEKWYKPYKYHFHCYIDGERESFQVRSLRPRTSDQWLQR